MITLSFTEMILVCYRKGIQYFGVMKVHFVLLILRWFGHFGTLAASGKFIKQLSYIFFCYFEIISEITTSVCQRYTAGPNKDCISARKVEVFLNKWFDISLTSTVDCFIVIWDFSRENVSNEINERENGSKQRKK